MTSHGSTDPSPAAVRIVMIPDYRSTNPYQRLIAEGLERHGAHVAFSQKPRRALPLLATARAFDVDVVHLHWITPFLRNASAPLYLLFVVRLIVDLVMTRLSGVRVVWTVHNKVSHEARHPRFELWARRGIARVVDAIIVHSPEICREIAADFRLPPAHFDIIPHASFGDLYGERLDIDEARRALGLDRPGRVFLNFGLMRPYKGLKRLMEAWAASGLGDAGHTLLLAGAFSDPAYRADIEAAAAPLPGVRIDAGFVPDDRVRYYHGACAAVVLPFEKILTSSSLHLAITFGKPVIAPRIASVRETIGAADGFTYDANDPNGLRDALRRCAVADLTDERRHIERIRTALLDWDGVAQATLAVYERVLRGRRRRSPR